MKLGMNQYEWEGMGLKKTFLLISNSGAMHVHRMVTLWKCIFWLRWPSLS